MESVMGGRMHNSDKGDSAHGSAECEDWAFAQLAPTPVPPSTRVIDIVITHGGHLANARPAMRTRATIGPPRRGDGVISGTAAVREFGERRNIVLRQLRDAVATQYGLHASALAPLGEQTLTTMATHVEQGLVRVTVFRVEGSVTIAPLSGSSSPAGM